MNPLVNIKTNGFFKMKIGKEIFKMAYKNSLRVALYARFSSDNQRSESIDAQVRAMTKYCKENNYKIVATYIDKAKSAMTDKHTFFQDLILDAKKHIFDAVLVHKLDRFSRNRYDSEMWY